MQIRPGVRLRSYSGKPLDGDVLRCHFALEDDAYLLGPPPDDFGGDDAHTAHDGRGRPPGSRHGHPPEGIDEVTPR